MNIDYIHFAVRNIRYRKLRSYLTIIGIIIGIGAIIALISISNGLQNAIEEQFEKVGSNRLYIMPKGFTGTTNIPALTTDDTDQLKGMAEIEWVNPYLMLSDEVEFSREKKFVQNMVGVETEDLAEKYSDMDFELDEGRFQLNNERKALVVGYKLAHSYFDKEIPIRGKIEIKEEDFSVVGIMEEIGNNEDDLSIILPMDDVRELYDKPDEVSVIEMKLKPGLDVEQAAEKIRKRLKRSRDDENFEVSTPQQILEQIGELTSILSIILGGIAAISLVVGGIGIMNSLYTSVLERTRDIGIMKSIGATNKDILTIFIIEAGVIGLIGGFMGMVFGNLIAFGVGAIAKQQGFALLKIVFDWKLSLFGLLFAFFVGMLSGYLPSKRASELKPAEALRY